MKIISIIAQKGGAGKTTLAIHLSTSFAKKRSPVVIVDLDPQASATGWGDYREKENPTVTSAQSARLKPIIDTAKKNKVGLMIIDTAPHNESAALAAARAADLILIPCRPAILDLRAMSATVDLVRLARKPAKFIISAAQTHGWSMIAQAIDAIADFEIPIYDTYIRQRVDYSYALIGGETVSEYAPKSKAASDIRKLAGEIEKDL